jgi:CheY-like chemotaxis protein
LQAQFTIRTEEFFRAVEDWHPTHVAIDLVMPEMDGVEVLAKLYNSSGYRFPKSKWTSLLL